MKFATKLSLGCIALLSCALGAAGLLLTGQSFSGSLASTRTALQAQQEKEKYALERFIFQATDSAQFENYILASAAQQYAEQTADAGSSMALWLDGAYSLYSGLPAALPRTALKQALTDGENAWQLTRAAGRWYLLLTQPLDLPGVRADMLCAYDVSAVFATRDAQLRAWLAASAVLLVLGGGAAVLFSRRVTRPLTALQTASEKIADGEYTQRTQVKTDDEIGALSRSFDAMAAAVEGKINELSKTTQSQQDFIAAFTHEVKTPMTAMLGYADLMRARPDDAETQREAAGYIYHETQRLENLSRSLLALMGLDQTGALELVPCQDAGLLLQTVRSLPQGSTPVPRVISAGCVVQVDRSLWVDMLRNLTLNAQRACQGIEGAAITLRCERRAGQAVFTVTDTGCGIPAADLPRVTEAFYMVDKSRSRAEGGSGIGLALCARIANAHGARLEITSTEHVGTTVTIAVPEVLPNEREADNDTQSRYAAPLPAVRRCGAVQSGAAAGGVRRVGSRTAGSAPHPHGRGALFGNRAGQRHGLHPLRRRACDEGAARQQQRLGRRLDGGHDGRQCTGPRPPDAARPARGRAAVQ